MSATQGIVNALTVEVSCQRGHLCIGAGCALQCVSGRKMLRKATRRFVVFALYSLPSDLCSKCSVLCDACSLCHLPFIFPLYYQ